MDNSQVKNILIIKPSAMGDIVHALPALAAIRRAWPEANIAWLVRNEFAPLLREHPDLNEIILFDRKLFGKCWYSPAAMRALLVLVRQLRSGNFDLVFDMQGLLRSAIFGWVTGARRRIGLAESREGALLFYNDRVPQGESFCITDMLIEMVNFVSPCGTEKEFKLPHDEAAEQSAAQLLKQHGIEGDYAVLVPGSARPSKCWPVERFSSVADTLADKYGFKIAVVGSRGERAITSAIKTGAKTNVADLAGCTSIPELIAIMRGARIVVSNDTGPGHVAAGVQAPTVMIFGPTNPVRLWPYESRHAAIAGYDLHRRGTVNKDRDPAHAIGRITLDDVLEKVSAVLEKTRLPKEA